MTVMPFRARPAAAATAALALAGAAGALAAATPATATISDAPCPTGQQLAKQELRAEVNGRDMLIGKLYVFKDGRDLCAVTTSAGTLWDGKKKFMEVSLTVGGKSETDKGQFTRYAGRVRLRDTGGCFSAHGVVKLGTGPDDDVYATCPIWRKKGER